MSSLDIAASPPIRRDQTVQTALLLALAGGDIDAYTTKGIPDLALGLPVVVLLIVLLRCEVQRNEELI